MGLKTACEIVREGVALVTGEFLSHDFKLVGNVIEPFGLYRVLLEKAVDLVIQDYFINFPLHLRKMMTIQQTSQFMDVYRFVVPKRVEKIISIRNVYTKALIKRIDNEEKFLECKEPCYYYSFSGFTESWEIWCRNIKEIDIELIYIDKAVYGRSLSLKNEYDQIYLDSNLVIFAFCKELCVVQSAPSNKTEYFSNRYTNRLKYLIANEKYKENTVFDLASNSDREIR